MDWAKIGENLRDMGGWENTQPRHNPEHGAAPIADRPESWGWRPTVPRWLRDPPEPITTDTSADTGEAKYRAKSEVDNLAPWAYGPII